MADTKKIGVYLDVEAVDMLAHLAPSPKRRGQYLSDLIRDAARAAGMATTEDRTVTLERELARLGRELQALKRQQAGEPARTQ